MLQQQIEDLRDEINDMEHWVRSNHGRGTMTATQFKMCLSTLQRTYHCLESANDTLNSVGCETGIARDHYGEPD